MRKNRIFLVFILCFSLLISTTVFGAEYTEEQEEEWRKYYEQWSKDTLPGDLVANALLKLGVVATDTLGYSELSAFLKSQIEENKLLSIDEYFSQKEAGVDLNSITFTSEQIEQIKLLIQEEYVKETKIKSIIYNSGNNVLNYIKSRQWVSTEDYRKAVELIKQENVVVLVRQQAGSSLYNQATGVLTPANGSLFVIDTSKYSYCAFSCKRVNNALGCYSGGPAYTNGFTSQVLSFYDKNGNLITDDFIYEIPYSVSYTNKISFDNHVRTVSYAYFDQNCLTGVAVAPFLVYGSKEFSYFVNYDDLLSYLLDNPAMFLSSTFHEECQDLQLTLDDLAKDYKSAMQQTYKGIVNAINSQDNLTSSQMQEIIDSSLKEMLVNLNGNIEELQQINENYLKQILSKLDSFANKYNDYTLEAFFSDDMFQLPYLGVISKQIDSIFGYYDGKKYHSYIEEIYDNIVNNSSNAVVNSRIEELLEQIHEDLTNINFEATGDVIINNYDDFEINFDINANFGGTATAMSQKFPFCIPWDMYFVMGQLAHSKKAPEFEICLGVDSFCLFETYTISLEPFDELSEISRALLSLTFIMSLSRLTMTLIGNDLKGGD